jgi:two-component system chemotaxis response regulator CheY
MGRNMKMLVMEDEFVSRNVLTEILSSFGEIDVAENGKQALEKFRAALDGGKPYDCVFLDIMVPEINGQEVLRQIREIEQERGIFALSGVKIIMTTALGNFANVKEAFKNQCEAYLIKPIDREKVIGTIKGLSLI